MRRDKSNYLKSQIFLCTELNLNFFPLTTTVFTSNNFYLNNIHFKNYILFIMIFRVTNIINIHLFKTLILRNI